MKINDAINLAKNELEECESGSLVARNLMKFHLNLSTEQLFLKMSENLENETAYFALINRFKNGEPLEYITGKASFYSLEFDVFSGVLIPRPETEILVEKVLKIAKNLKEPRIAEIGVGSGIISVCLALNLKTKITATDINEIALKNAKQNALKFGVADKINLINTSYLDGVNENFDIIVSNPPYIANNYKLDKWVQNEPNTALFGGVVGDEILKEIITISHKKNVKFLACEIGYDQRESMQKGLYKFGYEVEFYKDLAGFDRGFVAYKT